MFVKKTVFEAMKYQAECDARTIARLKEVNKDLSETLEKKEAEALRLNEKIRQIKKK